MILYNNMNSSVSHKYKKNLGFNSTPVISFENRYQDDLKKREIKKDNLNLINSDQDSNIDCKSFKANCEENTRDFLINSSLHGLKYTANKDLSIFERIFFIISFVLVVILSGYFIGNVWNKWKATPIIISTSPTPTFTSSIPFPAITICNLNQVRKSRVVTLKEGTYNYTLLWSLCGQASDKYSPSYLGSWKSFRPVMLELAQPCKELLLNCSFGGNDVQCDYIFKSILTDDGLCCNFNLVDPQFMFKNFSSADRFDQVNDINITAIDWTPESGYPNPNDLPHSFFPRIARGTGKHMGLTVKLNASSKEYFCSATKGYGFKVLVHSPIEQPKIKNYGFLINSGTEVRVDILPSYTDSSSSIRSIDKKVRNCLFSDEGNLTYYRTYTRKNCEQECIANHMFRECGCVLYFLPRLSADIKICGPNDNVCAQFVERKISEANNNVTCEDCYPACFDLAYIHSMSSVRFAGDILDAYNYDFRELIMDDIAIVHFFYGSNFFRSMTKDEIIGFTEFLSNTGGLLGLFMGFSIFSLIEIVYYLSLRPYCKYQKKMTKKDKSSDTYHSERNVTPILEALKISALRPRTNILDKQLSRGKNEVSQSIFALLFSEIVQYCQSRSYTVPDLQTKLHEMGQDVGARVIDLYFVRERNSKRETKLTQMLLFIKTTLWKNLFGKEAEKLEHANDDERTYYIIEKESIVNTYISVPKDKGSLNCASFVAGIVEAVLTHCGFPCKVSAHWHKGTTYMVKFEDYVIARDKQLEEK